MGSKKTVITILFTAWKLIVFGVVPKGSKSNQLDIMDYGLPDLKKANLDFRRQRP
jgi:hypothetical protein